MFRLESYITPIILNYVAKYVKNIRPQDAQVSLWEGDVAFQNLDLRLDVLEDELNLPFEFLSGHIHELIIHVPWTKINSEPINITINTIEFILKLKDQDGRDSTSSPTNTSSPQKVERKKRSSRIEETQAGYSSPGLVNKIINNITINCHNIILKYVEEDIVVSMNIQLLSLHSADDNWSPAFVDVSPLKGLIRKVVEISDLTICLDKRNSIGHIEVCQEPILYKCSLQIRLVLKSLNGCKETKIALLTNLIEMNVSSLQFPMAIRLLNLLLALKTGDLKMNFDSEEKNDIIDEFHPYQVEPTWSSTLWNMLPNIFTEQEEEVKIDVNCGSMLDIGLYIEHFKFTLKSSEFVNESIVGTSKKIRYTPIISVFFTGIYCETLIDESKNWFSSKIGISKLLVEPLGQFCEEISEKYLIKSDNESKSNFVFESLFDPNYKISEPITNINEYLNKYSEDYLNYRAPSLNLNITRYKKLNEETDSESDVDEITYTFFLSSVYLCYNTVTNKIIDTIVDLIAMYDYPPYLPTSNDKDVKLSPPLLEDYDSFMTKVPVKVFHFNIRNISLKIFSTEEFYLKSQNRIKTVQKIPKKFKGKLPYFILNLKFCGGKWITPQDPELLVQTTCQLPKQPIELLDACYDNFFVNIKQISLNLYDKNSNYQLMVIPTAKVKISNLLYPHFWQHQCIAKFIFNLFVQDFTITFTKPRLIMCLKLIKTITSFDYETLIEIAESSTRVDIHDKLYELESVGSNFELNYHLFEKSFFTKGCLKNLKASIIVNDFNKVIFMESNETNNQNGLNWIEWSVQAPKIYENSEYSPILYLNIQNFSFFLNEFFVHFLNYTESKVYLERDTSPDRDTKLGSEKNTDRKSTKKSLVSSSRKISHPEETIHLSSEKGETPQNISINKNNEPLNSYRKMFYILKLAVLNIDINQGAIFFITDSKNMSNVYETATIWIPKILCKSRNCENFDFNKSFPIRNTTDTQKSFPWTCNVTSFSISLRTKEGIIYPILHPIETNITVAMNHKTETVPISNFLVVEAVDQIQERCDKKVYYNYEDNSKKKRDLVENSIQELDIQSTKCDWSDKEVHTDNVNKKNHEIEINIDENFIHVPSGSPKKNDKNEICDTSILKTYETQIERDNIAFNFHIDTSPIFLELNAEQVYFLQPNYDILLRVLYLLEIIGNNISAENDNFRIVTDFDEDTTAKEFLEMDSCSNSSSRFISDNSENIMISTWLQWTITKISLNIESFSNNRTTLSIEMEDFIISLDKQVDYIKIKSKLGTLSMRNFQINDLEEVKSDDSLKFNMKTNNSELPFIDLTITIADTKSVFKKIGAHKKADLNNQLYEIIILMQSFETTLDLEKLLEFIPLISAFKNNTEINNTNTKKFNEKRTVFTGSQLPLIYFDLGGFIIYMPVKTSKPNSSVLIIKVNEIKLSPNVKNPLTRKAVRSDVYNKAAQMGLLSVRGSIIEDRQYELIIDNISMASGNWIDLLSHMKDHEKNLLNANPAFDWNHQNFSKELKLQSIFSNFVIGVTYAPMIVYENIIVCGQSIEFNCVTDLNAKITTEHIKLFSCMYFVLTSFSRTNLENKIINFRKENNNGVTQKSPFTMDNQVLYTRLIESNQSLYSLDMNSKKNIITQIAEERDTDSGIATYEKTKRRSTQKQYNKIFSNEQNKNIPHEISFLAGVFTIECYHVVNDDSRYKSHNILIPLFSCTVSQPSMLISQKVYEKFLQFSLHNLTINLSSHSKTNNNENNFPSNVFSTLPGKLDISGIPPSLFSLKLHFNKSQKCNIICSISKPVKINLQHKTIEKIASIWVAIQEYTRTGLIHKSSYKKHITRGSKLKIIKQKLANGDKICIKLEKFIIKTEEHDKYEIEIILNNLKSEIIAFNRPEKLHLKLDLDSFYIKTENKICLHPLSIKSNLYLTQENWCKLPLITINLDMNVVQMDFGIVNFQNILNALNSFSTSVIQAQKILDHLTLETKSFYLNTNNDNLMNLDLDNLKKIRLPKLLSKEDTKNKEEFYQDDLRAGAFQFVETRDDSLLPMPYQIHIITKNHGIISWRYPQPRKICKMHIFPIPMPIANPIEIECQVEYFSDLYKKFLPFCEFSLSETKSIEIELPKRSITANIWRVKILQPLVSINKEYFDTSEEDEEVKLIKFDELDMSNETNFTLHPKVLVGCMKIDTCFNQEYIPKLEILFEIAFFELNLQNQQGKVIDSVEILENVKLINEFSSVETFISLQLKNIKIWAKFLTETNYSIDSELNFNAKILDYGFSNMQQLIEETNLKTYFLVNKKLILSNFISDAIKINIDPGILHTIVVSSQQWNQKIKFIDEPSDPIIGRFIISNITQHTIVFGQTNTNEKIYLNTQECVMYSFLSNIQEANLTFYSAENLNEFSDSFRVRLKNSVTYLKIGSIIYVIESKKLSSTQVSIYIKGQVDFVIMTNVNLNIQFRFPNGDGIYVNKSPEYHLNETGLTSFCHSISKEKGYTIRAKFDSSDIKLWSGDIPLRANKKLPWLVKIPISGTQDFISYWFRIISEEITNFKTCEQTPLRVLVVIWPIYRIKSMFPGKIMFKESNFNTELEITKRGGTLDLNLPATHETEHIITFNENFVNKYGEIRQSCNLSLKTIDWNQFFYYDDKKWTIDKCLMELQNEPKEDWPFKNLEELKIRRRCNHNKPPTEPIFRIYPSRELSCTLLLETSPWCIVINSLSSTIKIQCIETENNIQISSNELSRLFPLISSGFFIDIDCSLGWVRSLPIYFDSKKPTEIEFSEFLLIKDDDEIEIFFFEDIIHKLILKSVLESGRRVLIVKPIFVLVNYSNVDFSYFSFCLLYNQKASKEEIEEFAEKYEITTEAKCQLENFPGIALDIFYNLSGTNSISNKDSYNFYLTIFDKDTKEITSPIVLGSVFNRKCISLQKNNNSIPLCINNLEKDGQYFINIFDDSLPTLEINNYTDLSFLIAQTDSNENSTDVTIKSQHDNNNFEWNQILRNSSTLYYTPPGIFLNFPDNGNTAYNIVLALFNRESDRIKNIRWSKPLRVNVSCEKFFNIPMFGDVKIIVCDKHKTTKIFISYIAEQLEFSVKDLRSRLVSPLKIDYQVKDTNSLDLLENASQIHQTTSIEELNYKKCNHNTFEDAPVTEFNIFIKEIILSLSTVAEEKNFDKIEILAVYLDDLGFKYDGLNNSLQVLISNIQIDNQLFSSCKYDFPVILSSQDTFNRSVLLPSIYELSTEMNTYEEKALIYIIYKFRKDKKNFEINSILCKIKPIRAYIEDTYINDLLEFVTECSIENLVCYKKKNHEKRMLSKGHVVVPDQIISKAFYLAEPIKLESFRIEPLSVMFSVHTCIRFYIALDHSPLELAAFERTNIITLPLRLGYMLGMHYFSGALFGAGWVVGSLEILGSPSGLARCFTMGFKDFVTMPLEGFFRGPWGFIMGITHGSVSLVRNITAGTVNSVTKLASSVARNIDRLTFDEEHFQRTEIIRRTRPQGFTEGLSQGLTSLGINILGAVGGLARHPLEAQNPVQIVTGVGKGIVGAIAKPISGAAELVALTGHGVLHTVGFNRQPKQRLSSINYKIYTRPANSKIWKLLPKVLQFDQILFFHEATLVVENKLKAVTICMTSTVLAILELDKNELSYVLPVGSVIASFDKNDPTLINVNLKPKDELVDEYMNKQFARNRIVNFLRSSRNPESSEISLGSLEDLLVADKLSPKLDWSFYISENLGSHLLQYLKIANPHTIKDLKKLT